MAFYQVSGLAVLEVLGINMLQQVERIKISSPCVKAAVKIETPNLRKFDYAGDIIPFSQMLLKSLESSLYFYDGILNIVFWTYCKVQ